MLHQQPELFSGLPADQIEQALARGSRVSLKSGAQLFALGTAADRIFIIERGRIRKRKKGPSKGYRDRRARSERADRPPQN